MKGAGGTMKGAKSHFSRSAFSLIHQTYTAENGGILFKYCRIPEQKTDSENTPVFVVIKLISITKLTVRFAFALQTHLL